LSDGGGTRCENAGALSPTQKQSGRSRGFAIFPPGFDPPPKMALFRVFFGPPKKSSKNESLFFSVFFSKKSDFFPKNSLKKVIFF
jgi:hypothetical protein